MVKEQVVIIFNENKKRYGYRRITKELHNNDICVNHKTVRKLMKQLGFSLIRFVQKEVQFLQRRSWSSKPAGTASEDKPAESKWVTDIAEFKVNDQKLYPFHS